MGKIKVESLLINKVTKETNSIVSYGIKNSNKIIYNDNNIKVIINYGEDFLEVTRISDEYTIFLNLKDNQITKSKYLINELGTLEIITKTTFMSIKENEIRVNYKIIEHDDTPCEFNFTLKYEVI